MNNKKQCNKCLEDKDLAEFFSDKNSKDGRYSVCKKCKNAKTAEWRAKNRKRCADIAREWRKKNVEKDRWYNTVRYLRTRYKITPERYKELLDEHNHKCAICGGLESRNRRGIRMKLCIDHCHKTGKIRGILCSSCNSAIGYLRDDPSIIGKCIEYVEKYKALHEAADKTLRHS